MLITGKLRMMLLVVAPLLLELGGLVFIVQVDPYINKRHRKVMMIVIMLVFSLIAQQFAENITIAYSLERRWRIIVVRPSSLFSIT